MIVITLKKLGCILAIFISPKAIAASNDVKPNAAPMINGIVLAKPLLNPEEISIMLIGPGKRFIVKANVSIAVSVDIVILDRLLCIRG